MQLEHKKCSNIAVRKNLDLSAKPTVGANTFWQICYATIKN